MPRLTDAAIRRLDNWIPLFLLVLPTVMVFIPLLVQIHPKAALFVTPLLPSLFQILLILYAAVLGGWSRLRQVSMRRPVMIVAAAEVPGGVLLYCAPARCAAITCRRKRLRRTRACWNRCWNRGWQLQAPTSA